MRSSRVLRLGVGFKPRTPPPSRPPRSPSSLNRLSEAKRAKPGKPGVSPRYAPAHSLVVDVGKGKDKDTNTNFEIVCNINYATRSKHLPPSSLILAT